MADSGHDLEVAREALMGVALAWAAATGAGSAAVLELIDREIERGEAVVAARCSRTGRTQADEQPTETGGGKP